MAKWNDDRLIPPSSGSYMKLKQGENKIRIVSEAEVYGKHYINKKGIVCLGKEECPHCMDGDKPKPAWLFWVIDRTDGAIKLLEVGYSVVAKIKTLAQSEDYHFETMPDFDLTITKTGESLETEYDVIPARKNSPLTDEEKEQIDELKPPASIIEAKKKVIPEPF